MIIAPEPEQPQPTEAIYNELSKYFKEGERVTKEALEAVLADASLSKDALDYVAEHIKYRDAYTAWVKEHPRYQERFENSVSMFGGERLPGRWLHDIEVTGDGLTYSGVFWEYEDAVKKLPEAIVRAYAAWFYAEWEREKVVRAARYAAYSALRELL